jgi:hypothetical protein
MTENIFIQYGENPPQTGYKPEIVTLIKRLETAGQVVTFEELFKDTFPKAKIVCDDFFTQFMQPLNGNFSDKEKLYTIFKTDRSSQNDNSIIQGLNITNYTTPDEVYATLVYLASPQGAHLLDLPALPNSQEEYETNLILGYIEMNGKLWVLFIERELEKGEEELHLHIRRLNRWETDCPTGMVVV